MDYVLQSFDHPVRITKSPGGFTGICKDLQLTVSAPTHDEVETRLWLLIEAAYAERMYCAQPFPRSSKPRKGDLVLRPMAMTQAKAVLHLALRASGMSKGALGRALGMDYTGVGRLLDPYSGTSLGATEVALSVVGQGLALSPRR